MSEIFQQLDRGVELARIKARYYAEERLVPGSMKASMVGTPLGIKVVEPLSDVVLETAQEAAAELVTATTAEEPRFTRELVSSLGLEQVDN